MRAYDSKQHEFLLVSWYTTLRADPDELNKLLFPNLHNLTALLNWAAHQVKFFFDMDAAGLTCAAWLAPVLSGAEAGAWLRKDQRKSYSSAIFMNRFYKVALEAFPVIIGITCQPELEKVHLMLGYEKVGEVPYLYGGRLAVIYAMTKETRNGRRRYFQENKQHKQSLRSRTSGDRPPDVRDGEADDGGAGIPDAGGFADGGSERADTSHQRRRRKRTRSVQRPSPRPQESVGVIGSER